MTTQIRTTVMSIEAVMKCLSFKKGFKEVKRGKPFDYDYMPLGTKRKSSTTRLWNYERGRQFGHVFDGEIVKDRLLTYEARVAYYDADIR